MRTKKRSLKDIPKSRRKSVPTKGVTAYDRDAMFTWWMQNDRNTLATAKQFKRSHTLIHKIRKDDNWDERARKIDEKVKDGVDRKLVQARISNVTLVRACFEREVKAYLKKPEKKLSGSLQMIVMMAQYLDEAEGNLPRDPSESSIPEEVKKALEVLGCLDPKDIKRMADDIAHARKSLEGNGA